INVCQESLDLRRGDFSSPLPYLCRHSHSCKLHTDFRSCFTACTKLLYQSQLALRPHGFGERLKTRSFSAPLHSTSELLRTLSRVAASKPTSWLFVRSDLLRHLVFTLGP